MSNVLISNLTFVIENFEPKSPNMGILGLKVSTFLILMTLFSKTLGPNGPKSINFLILAKFHMYPISNVLISNLTLIFKNFDPKFSNIGILGQKVLTF